MLDYIILVLAISLIVAVIVLLVRNYSKIRIDFSSPNWSGSKSMLEGTKNIFKYSDRLFKILKPPNPK